MTGKKEDNLLKSCAHSHCSPVLQTIRDNVLVNEKASFHDRQIVYITGNQYFDSARWTYEKTIVENVPVASIFGMQNSIDKIKDCSFSEALFCFLTGKGKNNKVWTEEIYDYFKSSQDLDEYVHKGNDLERFGIPSGVGQLIMSRYENKYYCQNGKHRMVAGMFYLHCLDPKNAYFKNVKVDIFKSV